MNSDISEVVANIMTHHGALIEKTDEGCLEYICPKPLARLLEIPEEGSLVFQYNHTCEGAVHASYDSEMFQNMEFLFEQRGRIAAVRFEPSQHLNPEKIAKNLADQIGFSNATFRMDRTETINLVYLLVFFKYTALSDEKQEGLLCLLINRFNLSITPVPDEITLPMAELQSPKNPPHNIEAGTIAAIRSSFSAASLIVQEMMAEFIKSLNRRLNRDIMRINEYYETLKEETRAAMRKKALSNEKYSAVIRENPLQWETILDKHIENKTILQVEGIAQLYDKLDAIETEQAWKEQDLLDKYTLKIQVKPVTILQIETTAPVFRINLKRRQSSRPFPVTYNPLLKRLDPLPCESCFYPHPPYYVCDDKLHIVCSRCFIPCPNCGKSYCMACHKEGCPKCSK
ncbi:MAG TPA: hypothetical protein VJL89_09535 [Thermodesulfovibrionia bacterium]|nr:hypothetical protein [Thermodesulfovibrionia bacterium]